MTNDTAFWLRQYCALTHKVNVRFLRKLPFF